MDEKKNNDGHIPYKRASSGVSPLTIMVPKDEIRKSITRHSDKQQDDEHCSQNLSSASSFLFSAPSIHHRRWSTLEDHYQDTAERRPSWVEAERIILRAEVLYEQYHYAAATAPMRVPSPFPITGFQLPSKEKRWGVWTLPFKLTIEPCKTLDLFYSRTAARILGSTVATVFVFLSFFLFYQSLSIRQHIFPYTVNDDSLIFKLNRTLYPPVYIHLRVTHIWQSSKTLLSSQPRYCGRGYSCRGIDKAKDFCEHRPKLQSLIHEKYQTFCDLPANTTLMPCGAYIRNINLDEISLYKHTKPPQQSSTILPYVDQHSGGYNNTSSLLWSTERPLLATNEFLLSTGHKFNDTLPKNNERRNTSSIISIIRRHDSFFLTPTEMPSHVLSNLKQGTTTTLQENSVNNDKCLIKTTGIPYKNTTSLSPTYQHNHPLNINNNDDEQFLELTQILIDNTPERLLSPYQLKKVYPIESAKISAHSKGNFIQWLSPENLRWFQWRRPALMHNFLTLIGVIDETMFPGTYQIHFIINEFPALSPITKAISFTSNLAFFGSQQYIASLLCFVVGTLNLYKTS